MPLEIHLGDNEKTLFLHKKTKKSKLALTSFYHLSREILLGKSLKFIYIDQSRFYNFSNS